MVEAAPESAGLSAIDAKKFLKQLDREWNELGAGEFDGEYEMAIKGIRRQFGPSLMRVLFPCKDGHVAVYIIGGSMGSKGQRAFVEWMDSEGLADDFLRYFDWDNFDAATFSEELAMKLEAPFERFYLTKTKEELFEEALKSKFLLAPVYSTEDLMKMEHLKARDFWVEVEHPELEANITYPGAAYKSSVPNFQIRGRAPLIGEHNQEIYGEGLGIPQAELAELKSLSVI